MKKDFNKKSIVIFAIGILMIAAAVVTYGSQNQKAKAATNYNYTWTLSKWRVKDYVAPSSSSVSGYVTLGPSEWTVTGNIGGKTISETWTVSTWLDQGLDVMWGSTVPRDTTSAPNFSASIRDIYGTAYGATVNFMNYAGFYVRNTNSTGSHMLPVPCFSMPTKWTVTGSIQ